MRWLALLLIVCAAGALTVSLLSREQRFGDLETQEVGWTSYEPLDGPVEARDGITPIDRIDMPFDESPLADVAFDEYDNLPWDDARLWLGAAIGLGAAGLAVGAVSLRRRD